MAPTKEQILGEIRAAHAAKEPLQFDMGTLPETVTVEDIAQEIKQLTGKDTLATLQSARAAREPLEFPFDKVEPYTPEQMQEVPKPSYAESIVKGFKQEDIPAHSGMGRQLAHGLAQEALPITGGIAGAPAGILGVMTGAAAGRAWQKAGRGVANYAANTPQSTETPLEIGKDVASTGILQGVGEGVFGKLGIRATVTGPGTAKGAIKGSPLRVGVENITTGTGMVGMTNASAAEIEQAAVNEINAILKPKDMQYAYGKNPGKGIIEEGITGSDYKEITQNVISKLEEIGQAYKPILDDPLYRNKRLNVDSFTAPLEAALVKARRNPRTNQALINRLENAKRDLRMELDNATTGEMLPTVYSDTAFKKMKPQDVLELKRVIGDITKFTANSQEDNIVNTALKQSYRYLDERLDAAVPPLKRLNERYANLLGAKVASANRDLATMNRRSVMPAAEVVAGTVGGWALGHPAKGLMAGLAVAGIHKAATDPYVISNLAQGATKYAAPALRTTAQGLSEFGTTQLPQTAIRKTIEEDPLGLFQ